MKKLFFQLILTAFFIWLALSLIDFKKFGEICKHINIALFLVSLIGVFAGIFFTSVRWRLILKNQGLQFSFAKVFQVMYVGEFCSNFLPGTLTGDIAKGVLVIPNAEKKVVIAGTIILDRLIGFIAMLIMATFAVSTKYGDSNIRQAANIIYSMFGIVLIVYLIYFNKHFRTSELFTKLKNAIPFKEAVKDLDAVMKSAKKSKPLLGTCILLSLAAQAASIIANYGFVKALDIKGAALGHLFILFPIIWIITVVPISIGGWGVGEVLFAYFFSTIGVDKSAAIALSVVGRISRIIVAAPAAYPAVLLLSRLIADFWRGKGKEAK